MQVIIVIDDINEIIAVYAPKKFIEVVNEEFYEVTNFKKDYFTLSMLDIAIDWFVNTSDNLSVDVKEVEE